MTGAGGGAAILARDLTVNYDGRAALRAVSLACRPGEITGVVGPNGAGKSTLLKALTGLLEPSGGEVRVLGGAPSAARPYLAYVPQRSAVDWDYPATVRDIVAMGRIPHLGRFRRPSAEDRELVSAALERVGLSRLADRPIGALSGGQRQRTEIARAFAQEARVLLLDEPFAGVDAVTERLLWDELARGRDEGLTILLVNHDLAITEGHCDRLVLLSGRLVASGRPAEVLAPANVMAAYGALPMREGGHRP